MTTDRLGVTPAQTVGPFLHLALPWPDGPYVVPEGTDGAFWVHGRVLDGVGAPVVDGLVESWQADPDGRFDHPDDPRGARPPAVPGFRGFGRSATDATGRYALLTVKPGPLPDPDGGTEAPHVNLSVFARGMLHRVVTRLYFPDEAAANAADPVLRTVEPDRRHTLVATAGPDGLLFDIHLQGDHETVFFAV
ncbi:protocatechuate 3,4-dioxygenase subunit alpha [Micromonospora zhanjiangensis]|uniref:Protocatechuate 3,4-dioxygenase subunit alpha n=1 Tax=Micromonospora zhanjiangensis TaxID=1522057 RepID=A0ABV8KIV3_9ACTN